MTTVGSLQVEEYYDAVRAALSDLPEEQRDELIEDLPGHLDEVLAEGEGSLVDRLGQPEDYAADLRAAAGMDSAGPLEPQRESAAVRIAGFGRKADRALGELLGAESLVERAALIQPAWWVARGWLVAEWIMNRDGWTGIIPRGNGGQGLEGLGLLVVCVVASVWLGVRIRKGPNWLRLTSIAVSLVIACWGIFGLNPASATSAYSDNGGTGYDPTQYINDLYVYDQNGNLVPHARIYDQNGNPVDLGNPCYDENGNQIGSTTANGDYTYPLCQTPVGGPAQPGPLSTSPAAGTTPPSTPTTTSRPATGTTASSPSR